MAKGKHRGTGFGWGGHSEYQAKHASTGTDCSGCSCSGCSSGRHGKTAGENNHCGWHVEGCHVEC